MRKRAVCRHKSMQVDGGGRANNCHESHREALGFGLLAIFESYTPYTPHEFVSLFNNLPSKGTWHKARIASSRTCVRVICHSHGQTCFLATRHGSCSYNVIKS